MRITYRTHGIKEFWTTRWDDIPADDTTENLHIYPLKYAELAIKDLVGSVGSRL